MIVQRLRNLALSALMLLSFPAIAQAEDAKHFSILPSDGQVSAGQTPPRDGDRRIRSREGLDLWLGATPVVIGGIKGVRLASGYQGHPLILLQLTDAAAAKVAAYTASHIGQRLAYVLDGQIVGQEVMISAPLSGNNIAISTEQGLEAAQLLADQLSATIVSGG